MGYESFDDAISASHAATDRIMRGDAGGFKDLYSRRGDITLGNPFGGFGRGWDGVVEQLERAASYFSDGRATDFEEISKTAANELGYTVEIERVETKVAGREEQAEFAARVTSVYRREEDGWKLIHRHADPRVSRQTRPPFFRPEFSARVVASTSSRCSGAGRALNSGAPHAIRSTHSFQFSDNHEEMMALRLALPRAMLAHR